jgi:hypothetical protein
LEEVSDGYLNASLVMSTSYTCDLQIFLLRQEMLRRYPDQEATMGEARLVGETGPDAAGKRLSPTTIKVCFAAAIALFFPLIILFVLTLSPLNLPRNSSLTTCMTH